MLSKSYQCFISAIFVSFVFSSVSGNQAYAQTLASELAQVEQPLIPASVFGALPEYQQPSLSPSGTKVAFIKNVTTPEHRALLATFDFKTGKQTVLFASNNETVRFRWFRWANEDTLLVSVRFLTRSGSSRYTSTRMMSLKFDQANQDPNWLLQPKRRTNSDPLQNRESQFADRIIDMLRSDPEHVLVALDRDVQNMPSVFKVNISTGKTKRIEMAKHDIRDWTTDRQGVLRVGEAFDYETGTSDVYVRKNDEDSWRKIYTFNAFEDASNAVYVSGFGLDPNILYIRKYKGYHLALYKVNLSTMEETLVFSDDTYDVDGALAYSVLSNDVIGVFHRAAKHGVHYFDKKHYALHDALASALPSLNSSLYDLSVDERKYLMYAESDSTPGQYYIGDRDKGSLNYLFGAYSKITPNSLPGSKRIEYKSRDGLDIEAYITLPKTGKAPYPLIVHPHGGPSGRVTDGFDYWTSFFASRGYAVIRPNFRGSSGFGVDFSEAQMGAWGLQMQDDITDATQWMIKQGYANKDKMCIVGASYGGYAATMASTKTPELFKCVVSFAGVTDLVKLTRRMRNDFAGGDLIGKEQIGSSTSDLKARSPLHNAEKIIADTLIVHGEYDDVVNIEQSRNYVRGLKSIDKSVTYLELEDGDHYLLNAKNRIAFFEAMDAFLAKHLK
ncbi:S9 family peptidase [Glaciecola sp. MH2013]|uniref:alpha/beta hydrolase family protein n=1 Tax=Glaciecola sp. MH2013 TaxID=2785524 RepID=UPI00189C8290|nr:S9 family peptidase [Glaciecola sp. MH2013]MBF7074463.1 S9 family peptidase [Glaciecola sp. MH2013]